MEIVSRYKKIILASVLALISSFVLYGNILNGDFVYDDNFFVDRQELRDPSYLVSLFFEPYLPENPFIGRGFYRPLWVASLSLNFIIFGESPVSFHIVNTILYAAILTGLFVLSDKLFKNTRLAFFITAFFAFLPIHTEVVANIKSRDELLSSFFTIGAWLVFLKASEKYIKPDIRLLAASAALIFLGLLSKESVILAPFLFIAIWLWEKKPPFMNALRSFIPYLITYIIYFVLRVYALGEYAFGKDNAYFIINPIRDAELMTRISSAFKIAYIYISKTFVPLNLSASYDYNHMTLVANLFTSWEALAGFIFLSFLAIVSFLPTDKFKIIKTGALTFLIPYLVISKFILPKGGMMGERFVFFPSIGLSIIAGYVLYVLQRKFRRLGLMLFIGVLIFYGYVTIARNRVWQDPVVFFERMAKDAPRSVQARSALARGYFHRGQLNEAKKQAMIGESIYSDHPPLLEVLGKLAYMEADYEKAAGYFKKAFTIEPYNYESNHFYALTLLKLGRYQEALGHIAIRLEKNPNDKNMRFIKAVALYKTGRKDMAEEFMDWTDEIAREEKIKVIEVF